MVKKLFFIALTFSPSLVLAMAAGNAAKNKILGKYYLLEGGGWVSTERLRDKIDEKWFQCPGEIEITKGDNNVVTVGPLPLPNVSYSSYRSLASLRFPTPFKYENLTFSRINAPAEVMARKAWDGNNSHKRTRRTKFYKDKKRKSLVLEFIESADRKWINPGPFGWNTKAEGKTTFREYRLSLSEESGIMTLILRSRGEEEYWQMNCNYGNENTRGKPDSDPAEGETSTASFRIKKPSSLMRASYSGDIETIRRLLKIPLVRDSINEKNNRDETAFYMATEQGHEEIMDLLLTNGADPVFPDQFGYNFLMRFTKKGDIEAVRRLLRIPLVREKINEKNHLDETAFYMAAEEGHWEIMDLLLTNGADPVSPTENGKTFLMRFSYKGNIEAVRRLLEIPAVRETINAKYFNKTALDIAKEQGHMEIVELLRAHGGTEGQQI